MKFSGLELPAESILPWNGQSGGVSIRDGTRMCVRASTHTSASKIRQNQFAVPDLTS